MIAAPGQLLSISHISQDPLMSPFANSAKDMPTNLGRAEDIYRLAPDLVLAGTWSDPFTIALLRDLGIRVEQLPTVNALSDIPAQVRHMGALLGQEDTADALARKVEDAPPPPTQTNRVAAFFYANGYSLGTNTLAHDIIRHAGYENLAERLGRSGGARLSLEELLMQRPDVIVTSPPYAGNSRSEDIMTHPALADIPRIQSTPDWVCGTPFVLRAIAEIHAD